MCTISMVYDNFRQIPQDRWTPSQIPAWTSTHIVTEKERTPLVIFEELCKVAKELDEALGLADCEDPKKGQWLEQIREIVKQHEINKIEERLNK